MTGSVKMGVVGARKSEWEHIPEGISAALVARLEGAAEEIRNLRLVCSSWRDVVDSNVAMLAATLEPEPNCGDVTAGNNELTGPAAVFASLLPRLQSINVLDVSDLQVTDQLLQAVSAKTQLTTLQICAESATASILPDSLSGFGNLKRLDNIMLSFHPEVGIRKPCSLRNWFKGEELSSALRSTPGPKSAALCFCSRAEDDGVYKVAVEDTIKVLQACPDRLEELHFWGCLVSVSHLNLLEPFQSLHTIIDLENFWAGWNFENAWTAEMLQALRPLQNLKKLSIPCRMEEMAAKQLLPQVQDWTGTVFGYRIDVFAEDDNSSQDSFDGEQLETAGYIALR